MSIEPVSLVVPLGGVLSVGVSLINDADGGGGGTEPHCISPAIVGHASAVTKTKIAQSWRRGFMLFSWVDG